MAVGGGGGGTRNLWLLCVISVAYEFTNHKFPIVAVQWIHVNIIIVQETRFCLVVYKPLVCTI